ncbi:hypothetical protein ACN38_g7279, partial [Penicillium nordicum]
MLTANVFVIGVGPYSIQIRFSSDSVQIQFRFNSDS